MNHFKKTGERFSKDINATLVTYEHTKSGARLAAVLCDDPNKVFQIGFRTPSNNSTGVAHILEHSTLCGSRKYPVKEPFVELAKGSLNTFLNAMTYPDKTVYPIASTNDKDFRNLTDVYLDAVFYPNIYKNPFTFMQEGWHYELRDKSEPLTYNGVVYNEMKGVFSSPEAVLERETFKILFPDSFYGEESGGDPANIPDLSYEDFLNFHKTLYHPSNSYIYLYGNIDINEQLDYLDGWLNAFDQQTVHSEIGVQAPFKERVLSEAEYAVSPEEDLTGKDYLSLNYVLPPDPSAELNTAVQILGYLLLDSNASVLKKALLEKDLAKDISYSYATSMRQPVFTIDLKNAKAEDAALFLSTVEGVMKELIQNGISKEDLEAAINLNEFKTLEILGGETGTTPRGLLLGLNMMESWLYDGDPFERMNFTQQIQALEELKNNGGFEKLLSELFLNNPHQALITMKPNKELAAAKEVQLKKKLSDYKNTCSDAELEAIIENSVKLEAYQQKADTPEELSSIPRLSVSEITTTPENITWKETEINGIPLLYHHEDTKGIVYVNFFFDFGGLDDDEIKTLSLFNKIFARVSTHTLGYEEINRQTDLYTGGIHSSVDIDTNIKTGELITHFTVSGKARLKYLSKMVTLIKLVTTDALYNEKELIHSIVQETRMAKQNQILNSGHTVALQRLQAGYLENARLFEEAAGIEFYRYLCELDDNFDEMWPAFSEQLAVVAAKLYASPQLTISLTCPEEDKDKALSDIVPFIQALSKESLPAKPFKLSPIDTNEAFMTAGGVQYNAKGGSFDASEYSGSLLVLKTMLSMDYLWNKVRVQGGAYGAFFGATRTGNVFMTSYRDPNLKKTYQAYDTAPAYIENLELPQAEVDKYIVGTISAKDVPLSPHMRSIIADSMYFSSLTMEDIAAERRQILHTSLDDLRAAAPIVKEAFETKRICTIGTESAVKENEEAFEKISYIE